MSRKILSVQPIVFVVGILILISAIALIGRQLKSSLLADAIPATITFSTNTGSGPEAVGNVDITVSLSVPSSQAISVDYTISGSAYGINEGTGQDFVLPPGKLTFLPNETSKVLKLGINNDKINETDETVDIYLLNPTNAILAANNSFRYTILDDDRKFLADVTNYGAKGNGVADDSAAINNAIVDTNTKGGGVVYFPPGIYKAFAVKMEEGITYEGYGATIKRPDLNYLRKMVSPNKGDTWEHSQDISGTRLFANSDWYSGDADSAPLVIRGLLFDGNSANQKGWVVDRKPAMGGYPEISPYTINYQAFDLEQASDIIVAGRADKPGRVKLYAEDLSFINGISDGLHVVNDVDATVYNLRATNTFRGGFTFTGGHSIVKVKKLTTSGNVDITGTDVEVDSKGYGGTYKSEITMEDINIIDGKFNINFKGDESNFIGKRIYSNSPIGFTGYNSHIYISDSKFLSGPEIGMGEMRWPHDVTFENTIFQATRGKATGDNLSLKSTPLIAWNPPSNEIPIQKNQKVTYKNCIFDLVPGTPDGDKIDGILTTGDNAEYNNTLIVDGGSISSRIDHGIRTLYPGGGNWQIKNLENNARQPFNWIGSTAFMNLSIDGSTVGNGKYMLIEYPSSGSKLTQNDVYLDQSNNFISSYHPIISTSIGGRTILGDNPPTSATHCFAGDVYRLKTIAAGVNFEWDCTKTGFKDLYNGDMASSWQARAPLSVVAMLGTPLIGSYATTLQSLTVAGTNITAYKYRLDNGNYSSELAVKTPIILNNLSLGKHKIEIVGKNNTDQWQDQARPTSYVWLITDTDKTPPVVLVSGEATTTSTNTINLGITGIDKNGIKLMRISNMPDFNSATEMNYTPSKSWTLLPNGGNKQVYVWLGDGIENTNWTAANAPYIYTIRSLVADTDLKTPPIPTGLKTTTGSGKVNLQWNQSSGAQGYNVYRREKTTTGSGTSETEQRLGSTTTATYTDDKVDLKKNYSYSVSSYISPLAESEKSAWVDVSFSDNNPPVVKIDSPINGATVNGTTTISATATDDKSVVKVEFYLGASKIGETATLPYKINWDSKNVANGNFVLTAKAYDSSPIPGVSQLVNILVNNSVITPTVKPPTTNPAPLVKIMAPVNGTRYSSQYTYRSKVVIYPTFTSKLTVTKAEYFIDGSLKATLTGPRYSYQHQFTTKGPHTIQIKAYCGNSLPGISPIVNITIN